VVAVLIGLTSMLVLRRRAKKAEAEQRQAAEPEPVAAGE
jgi:hypothetical protein